MRSLRQIAITFLIAFITAFCLPRSTFAGHDNRDCWNNGVLAYIMGGGWLPDFNFRDWWGWEKGDPVNLSSGQLSYSAADLSLKGRGQAMELIRYYNSLDKTEGPFGYGWSHNFDINLTETVSTGTVRTYCLIRHLPSGSNDRFERLANGLYKSPDGSTDTLFVLSGDAMASLSGGRISSGYVIRTKHGMRYVFNIDGALIVISDRNNNKMNLYYDSVNKLRKVADTIGRETVFAYNIANKVSSVTDYSGRTTSYAYDDKNNLVSVTQPSTPEYPGGLATIYSYDDNHSLTAVRDARGNTYLQNIYDEQGRVTEQNYGNTLLKFVYTEGITTLINPNGVQTDYYLNADGTTARETTIANSGTGATTYTTAYEYNANKDVTKIVYPKGNSEIYTYDGQGNMLTKTLKPIPGSSAADITITHTYEASYNQIKTLTDPKGNVTTYDYDNHGNLISVAYPQVGAVRPVETMSYDGAGQLLTMTNAKGITTKYEYNVLGLVAKKTLDYGGAGHLNASTSYGYDQWGNLTSICDANNHSTYDSYNALNWLTQRVQGDQTARYRYDQNGNLVRIERKVDSTGTDWQITEYSYDVLDRVVETRNWLSDTDFIRTSQEYDTMGNKTRIVDAEGHAANYGYDDRNLLTSIIDTQGNKTEYGHDGNGNISSINDAKGNITSYQYDGFNRLTRTTYPDGSYEELAYDANGNITSKHTRKGDVIQYSYDALNRLTRKAYPDNTEVNCSYDIANCLNTIFGAVSAQSYTYDSLNRITQALLTINSTTYTVGYAYDKVGNKTQVTYPDNSTISYSYNEFNRLSSIKDSANNTIAAYQYDPLSRRTSASFGNTTSVGYAYDNLNRVASIVGPEGTRSYSYDNIGNALSMDGPEGNHGYSYDSIYQLTSVTYPSGYFTPNSSWIFDQLGNRASNSIYTYTTNSLNQYTSVGQSLVTYDPNGNLTYDVVGSSYTYDCDNRLIRVETSTMTAVYQYDPSGRRVSKTINGVTIYYIYDGSNVIAEYDLVGNLERKYVFGQRIDEPVMMVLGVNKYYYHADRLGSITGITDETGGVFERYQYDAYGNLRVTSANNEVIAQSTVGNRFAFTGREVDWETGLYYYRARYYDPKLERFLQADPIGYIDSVNMYAYVHNNPINMADPLGLFGDGRRRGGDYWGHSDFQGGDRFDFTKEDYGWTNPFNPFGGTQGHFRALDDVQEDLEKAIADGDRDAFAKYMHQGQDYFSHYQSGFNHRWWLFGHLFEGQGPDWDPSAWIRAEKWSEFWLRLWDKVNAENTKC